MCTDGCGGQGSCPQGHRMGGFNEAFSLGHSFGSPLGSRGKWGLSSSPKVVRCAGRRSRLGAQPLGLALTLTSPLSPPTLALI